MISFEVKQKSINLLKLIADLGDNLSGFQLFSSMKLIFVSGPGSFRVYE